MKTIRKIQDLCAVFDGEVTLERIFAFIVIVAASLITLSLIIK